MPCLNLLLTPYLIFSSQLFVANRRIYTSAGMELFNFYCNLPWSYKNLYILYFLQTTMINVVIMYPNSSTSVALGKRIVAEMANVAYYIPSALHEQASQTCYEEVKVDSARLAVSVDKITSLREAIIQFFNWLKLGHCSNFSGYICFYLLPKRRDNV